MDERESQLQSEQSRRQQVAGASIAAGVLLLAGALYDTLVVSKDLPLVGLIQGLGPLLRGGAIDSLDPRSGKIIFADHHAAGLIAAAVVLAIASFALAPVLRYLADATRFRRPQTSPIPGILAIAGPVAAGLFSVAVQIATVTKAHDFVRHGDHSRHAVDNVLSSGPVTTLGALATVGELALVVAFVMISLNAMRAGLLTRFMGVLGIIVGVLTLLPQLAPLPVVQAFWLVGFGAILLGRAPNPLPPAWSSGEAMPWPSQRELRERRAGSTGGTDSAASPAPSPAPAPASAARKRKRKRK